MEDQVVWGLQMGRTRKRERKFFIVTSNPTTVRFIAHEHPRKRISPFPHPVPYCRQSLMSPIAVFLDEGNSVKLGDFGLSKALPQASFAQTYVGVRPVHPTLGTSTT